MPQIKIQNVVATFRLGRKLDLDRIRKAFADECFFETLDNRMYSFRVVALRIRKPKMTLLIYRTGKVVCTGAKSLKDAEQSADCLLDRLRRVGLNIQVEKKAKIQNIVATSDLKTPIDIERFTVKTKKERQFHVIYEPEQFPAAIVRFPIVQGSEATVLIFNSGKLVCVGLSTYGHIQKAIEFLISKL
jgi:transcription initiation factor TFIID TATA-box-binding protein